MSDFVVVLITAPNEDDAAKMANDLVVSRLAACVNIIRNIRSIYRWQGKIEDEAEVLMLVKTRKEHFKDLEKRVRGLHPYTVPEIIALPIIEGSEGYLGWLREETSKEQG
jgi:periplasmic divalent cation tolerance protein